MLIVGVEVFVGVTVAVLVGVTVGVFVGVLVGVTVVGRYVGCICRSISWCKCWS